MLMSRPKRKDQREGAPSILYLLPELCTMTGLTQTMRENFTMMKDLAIYTRVEPTKRAASMTNFMDMVKANPDVQERMQGWGVQFGASLVKLDGRQLPPEKIYLGSDRGQQGPKQVNIIILYCLYALVIAAYPFHLYLCNSLMQDQMLTGARLCVVR